MSPTPGKVFSSCMLVVSGDNIAGFDEGPLEALVGLGSDVTEVGLAAARSSPASSDDAAPRGAT